MPAAGRLGLASPRMFDNFSVSRHMMASDQALQANSYHTGRENAGVLAACPMLIWSIACLLGPQQNGEIEQLAQHQHSRWA